MAIFCLVLVIWSLWIGRKWAKHWVFIVFEATINIFIVFDIVFKLKLVGCK